MKTVFRCHSFNVYESFNLNFSLYHLFKPIMLLRSLIRVLNRFDMCVCVCVSHSSLCFTAIDVSCMKDMYVKVMIYIE